MIVDHPDGERAFVMQKGTPLMATVEIHPSAPGLVTIGHYGNDGLSIDNDEWDAFIELVVAVDRVKRGVKRTTI